MKQTSSDQKRSSPTVEPLIISRLQRATAAQIARERARAAWRQRALRILLAAVAAALGLRVLTIAAQPCLAAYRSAREIDVLRAQLLREEQRHQHLKSELSFLQSDHGVEEEARKLGWTRAGEVSLQLVTPEPPPAAAKSLGTPHAAGTSPSAASAAKTPIHISGSERLRLWLTHWLENHQPGKREHQGGAETRGGTRG